MRYTRAGQLHDSMPAARRTSDLRARGEETHVTDFGDGDVGRHNWALWRQREAEYDAMAREIAAEFCDDPPEPRSCSAQILEAMAADPRRAWSCRELQRLTGRTSTAVSACLTRLKRSGKVRRVAEAVWAVVVEGVGRPCNVEARSACST